MCNIVLRKLAPEVQKVLDLYDAGLEDTEIAEEVKMTEHQVADILDLLDKQGLLT